MKLPEPFWAVVLAVLGVIVALAVLFHPNPAAVGTAVLAIASNLVSGALGAFAGHASATSNSTGPNATINNPGATFPGDATK
jgi:membrane associated rhomboid family serine protease